MKCFNVYLRNFLPFPPNSDITTFIHLTVSQVLGKGLLLSVFSPSKTWDYFWKVRSTAISI